MLLAQVRDLVSLSLRRIARDDTERVLGKVIAEIENNCHSK